MNFVTFKNLGSFGRLGNQLFQLAATIDYANKYKIGLKIPIKDTHHEDNGVGKVDYVANNINLGIEFLSNDDVIDLEYRETTYKYLDIPYTDKNLSLNGYFQSEKYFLNSSDIIRSKFLNFNQDIQNQINSVASQLPYNKTLTAIHVRRGDYLIKQDYHVVLGLDYYKLAKEEIGGNQTYVVFSDDIAWCREIFSDDHYFIDTGNQFVDLGVMSCCDNFIIANSSFSWWGAWLSNSLDKKIVAPKSWFGPRNSYIYTGDLIPDSWIKI